MKLEIKRITTFEKLPSGSLFICGSTLCLKTEYRTNGNSDAYIVGSGEYFWGGTQTKEDRDKLEVIEVNIKF